jgi:hypothetical protein
VHAGNTAIPLMIRIFLKYPRNALAIGRPVGRISVTHREQFRGSASFPLAKSVEIGFNLLARMCALTAIDSYL